MEKVGFELGLKNGYSLLKRKVRKRILGEVPPVDKGVVRGVSTVGEGVGEV